MCSPSRLAAAELHEVYSAVGPAIDWVTLSQVTDVVLSLILLFMLPAIHNCSLIDCRIAAFNAMITSSLCCLPFHQY